jgi:hypothetical protein
MDFFSQLAQDFTYPLLVISGVGLISLPLVVQLIPYIGSVVDSLLSPVSHLLQMIGTAFVMLGMFYDLTLWIFLLDGILVAGTTSFILVVNLTGIGSTEPLGGLSGASFNYPRWGSFWFLVYTFWKSLPF